MGHQFGHSLPPCMVYEDEHLLVVNKPAGWNTHAPSPYAGEGIYEWLKHREPRWANLAIIHRLDKETSGVMVFGKTTPANRSLTKQFASRSVRKQYVLLTDRQPKQREFVVKSKLVRAGEKYASGNHGELAETRFEVRDSKSEARHPGGESAIACCKLTAEPLTGRTHQIRVHAAAKGFPILGDTLYGGLAFHRLCLHSRSLAFIHPTSGESMQFEVAPDFALHWSDALLSSIIDRAETNAFRLGHGASHHAPGLYLDALGEYVLMQHERPLHAAVEFPDGYRGCYFKFAARLVQGKKSNDLCPKFIHGKPAPERFTIRENGVTFELSFNEGYSVGLFLDQRDNRRRLLVNHVAAGFPLFSESANGREVLNVFAYTCAFSVCAALAGARTTSLDLSKKYLEWGKRNFALNGLDATQHDFIYGDAFDWLRRLGKKGRKFDAVLLDPPTFSQSKEHGMFRAEKDYEKLVAAALPVLKAGGALFTSTNAAEWEPEKFLSRVEAAARALNRRVLQRHYVPQPPDFPITRSEPAHLKTVWLRLS